MRIHLQRVHSATHGFSSGPVLCVRRYMSAASSGGASLSLGAPRLFRIRRRPGAARGLLPGAAPVREGVL